MKEKEKTQEKMKKTGKMAAMKAMLGAMTFTVLLTMSGFYSYAGAKDVGKNAGNWILDQLFWLGLVILAIALAACLIKKAWVGAVITIVAGGVILVFIKNPEMVSNIGETLVHDVLRL